VELAPGDWVLSYTDALMESNDANGQMLASGRLADHPPAGDMEPES